MREGFETRRPLSTQPFDKPTVNSFTSDTSHTLRIYADLLALPAMAKPGRLSWPIRLARRALQALLRPWLAVQTRYNLLALEAIQSLHQEISALKTRVENQNTPVSHRNPARLDAADNEPEKH
jgi:hypothetical protein